MNAPKRGVSMRVITTFAIYNISAYDRVSKIRYDSLSQMTMTVAAIVPEATRPGTNRDCRKDGLCRFIRPMA